MRSAKSFLDSVQIGRAKSALELWGIPHQRNMALRHKPRSRLS